MVNRFCAAVEAYSMDARVEDRDVQIDDVRIRDLVGIRGIDRIPETVAWSSLKMNIYENFGFHTFFISQYFK